MPLDGGFLNNLKNELASVALGKRVDKVFVPCSDEIVLLLRGFGFSGRLLLSARNGSARINFTETPPENPKSAPMLCMLLRKYIGGAKITEISQMGFERVIKIGFEGRNELGDLIHPALYIELITGNCNIIFTDENNKILDCIHRSDIEKNTRIIQTGATYRLPKREEKLNITVCDIDEAVATLQPSENSPLWELMLKKFDGVSPLIAREIAFLAGGDIDIPANKVPLKPLKWALERLCRAQLEGSPHIIYKSDGTPADFSYMPIKQYGSLRVNEKLDSFSILLDRFYQKRDNAERIKRQSQDLLKLLTTLSGRISRKISARKADLKKCESKETLRIYGELIKANIFAISRGDSEAEVINYYDENGAKIKIPLNISLSAADNAQKYFKDYKKLCNAEKTLASLIKEGEEELIYIESVFEALTRAEQASDLAAIREELRREGYIKSAPSGKKEANSSKPMRFTTSGGFTVLVGKNNLQNDELTLRTADKTDLWFHTKNIHGSHAILRLEGKAPDEQDITEAAELAAYFSKGKNSSSVAVDYTPAKFVKKPAGARPGMVIYTTNKTAFVTPREETVERLRRGKD